MAINQTGPILTIDASAASATYQRAIPADTDAILIFWTGWRAAGAIGMSSITIDGTSIEIEENVLRSGDAACVGCGLIKSGPSTGAAIDIIVTWIATGGPTEGGRVYVVPVTSATGAVDVRDSGAAAETFDTNPGPVSLSSLITDRVIGVGYTFGSFPDLGIAGQTVILNDDGPFQNYSAELATVDAPGATTTQFDMNGTVDFIDYSTIAAMSLFEASAAAVSGSGTPQSQDADSAGAGERVIEGVSVLAAQVSAVAGAGNVVASVQLVLTAANNRELRDESNALVANLNGIVWEWYDTPGATSGAPVDSGTFNTDANGEATIGIVGSGLTAGQFGQLVLYHPTDVSIRGSYRVPVS